MTTTVGRLHIFFREKNYSFFERLFATITLRYQQRINLFRKTNFAFCIFTKLKVDYFSPGLLALQFTKPRLQKSPSVKLLLQNLIS